MKASPVQHYNARMISTRVLYYVICNHSAAMNVITSDTIIVPLTPWWEALLNALWITALVLCILFFSMMILSIIFRQEEENSTKIEIISWKTAR